MGRLSEPLASAVRRLRNRTKRLPPRARMPWRAAMHNERRAGNNRPVAPVLSVITALGILGLQATQVATAATGSAGARVDLTTDTGTTLMQATWRYRDARIV